MKIKKLKKLSILAFIFALISSSSLSFCAAMTFEEASNVNLNLTLPDHIKIEKADGSNTTAIVSVTGPRTLTITTPIAVSYDVSSNSGGKISVSATAPVSDGTGTINALYGTASDAMSIVFTRSDSTATADAVINASSSDASGESNINAIAFTLTPQTPTVTVGEAPTITVEDNALIYEIEEGSYNLPFLVDGNSINGTFSGHDSTGRYTATLTLLEIKE